MNLRYNNPPDTMSLVIGLACSYEAAAIFSGGHLPTLSQLHHRFEPLGWLIVGWIGYHLVHYEEHAQERVAEDAAERAVTKARRLGLLHR